MYTELNSFHLLCTSLIKFELLRSCSTTKPVEEGKSSFVRKAVSFVLITVTGGVALSALDDLSIYHSCSRSVISF